MTIDEEPPPSSHARGLAAAAAAAVDRCAARWLASMRAGPVVFGAMVGSGVWALRRPVLLRALDVNRPSRSDVLEGALHALVAFVAFCLIAAVVARWRRSRGGGAGLLESMDDLGRRLSPLLALPFVAMLRVPGVERDRPDLTLFFIAVTAVLCARGVYASSSRGEGPAPIVPRPAGSGDAAARYGAPVFVAALWAGYAFLFSRLSIDNHHALHTGTFDLGFYDNIFYQTSHGRPLGCSFLMGGDHRSGHFDPILVVLSPLYLIHPRAELLLVLQSVWLGAGTVPVYLIARRTLESRWAGVAFAVIYVLYPALHGANLYEFHSLALVGPLVLWALYFLEVGAHRAYFAALSLALLCREDVPLLACFIGIYAIADGRPGRVRAGWVTIAASVGYFLIVRRWIMPSGEFFNGGPGSYGYAYVYEGLIPHNRGVVDIALSFLTNPAFAVRLALSEAKIRFVLLLMLPLAFLPLWARPGRVMLIFGGLYCLLASHFALFSVHFYYASVVFPVAFALAPRGLAQGAEGPVPRALGLDPGRLRSATVAACLAAGMLVSWKFGAILDNESFRLPMGKVARTLSQAERETLAWVEAAVAQIPKEATLGVTNGLGPHASNRLAVSFYPGGPLPEYVFVDAADMRPEERARHEALVARGDLVPMTAHGTMALLRRR
jgi:uncharacterized membrane protein